MLKEIEAKINEIDQELTDLHVKPGGPMRTLRSFQLQRERRELLKSCADLCASDKVSLARNQKRPRIRDYIDALFQDFFEMRGDRLGGEDRSILGGIALYKGRPVTVIGHRKGKNLSENMAFRFGMPGPEGYRKALRLMEQAQKFGRPVITMIDTPGAYPGIEAEANGQSVAIARCLAEMSTLTVPVVAIVTGEGGSGGALALGVANRVLMLEHSVYSVLSPEGFAAILWKDAGKSAEAAELMGLTAQDLLALGVIDGIVPEPEAGAQANPAPVFAALEALLAGSLEELEKLSGRVLARQRYEKFRAMGDRRSLPPKEAAR